MEELEYSHHSQIQILVTVAAVVVVLEVLVIQILHFLDMVHLPQVAVMVQAHPQQMHRLETLILEVEVEVLEVVAHQQQLVLAVLVVPVLSFSDTIMFLQQTHYLHSQTQDNL